MSLPRPLFTSVRHTGQSGAAHTLTSASWQAFITSMPSSSSVFRCAVSSSTACLFASSSASRRLTVSSHFFRLLRGGGGGTKEKKRRAFREGAADTRRIAKRARRNGSDGIPAVSLTVSPS